MYNGEWLIPHWGKIAVLTIHHYTLTINLNRFHPKILRNATSKIY